MMHQLSRIGCVLIVLMTVAAPPAMAVPIVAGQTVLPSRAIQDITLFPGTPFNPTANPIFINDVFGDGSLIFDRNAQVGSTIVFPSLSGLYYGSHPMLGDYVFGSISPLTSANFSGSITNVVQNPADPGFATGQPSSFQSGDFSFGGSSFGFEFLTGPAAGIRLYTDPAVPFSFTSAFNGLPPSPGTVLSNSGVDFLNVTFMGTPVGTSSDRRIIAAVPEPTSMVLVGIGVVGLWCRRRRWQHC